MEVSIRFIADNDLYINSNDGKLKISGNVLKDDFYNVIDVHLIDVLEYIKSRGIKVIMEEPKNSPSIIKANSHVKTPTNSGKVLTDLESKFYSSLPEEFTTQDYFDTAAKLNILKKTAEKWMSKFVNKYCIVTRFKHGHYHKVGKTFTKTEVFIKS